MWGFQRHGIVPNLVVMGKPMGNGMPIAGVAARPELLAEFGGKVRYFDTFGGNSVLVAAAAAVLDVIEAEGLLANSRTVGGYLHGRLASVAATGTFSVAGAGEDRAARITGVRGAGLYVAADVVRVDTGAPDAAAAIGLVNGLRDRYVLDQRHRRTREHPEDPATPAIRRRARRPACRSPSRHDRVPGRRRATAGGRPLPGRRR